jgi:small subunit ribosomal protein S1
MVRQPTNTHEPPPMDESWWSALLAEEGKYSRRTPEVQSQREQTEDQDEMGSRNTAQNGTIDWGQVQRLFERDETVSLNVTGFNRGGLLVGSERLHGFVPVSHLIEINCQMDEATREARLETYVGRLIALKVIECDPERGRVVYSERAALAVSGRRNQLFCDVKPGDHVFGIVTNITDFGVFVDLGGVEGLVHVSELSWGRVRHPSDVAQVGKQVEAYVIQVDKERSRIALSLKRLHPNPWETAEQRYQPGQVVEVVVTSIVPFGVFARLEDGLDGLIHATELSGTALGDGSAESLCEGKTIQARVLNVDATRQRLGLSLKLEVS